MNMYPFFVDDNVPFLGFCVAQTPQMAKSYLKQKFPSLIEDSDILILSPMYLRLRTCFLIDMNLQIIENSEGLSTWSGEIPTKPIFIEDEEDKEDIIEGEFVEEKDDTYSWA